MTNNYFEEFIAKLQEIFMMDHAELDFGIYRIMNQKRDDIQDFLENRLLKQVGSSLDIDEKELERIQKRQKEILEMAGGDISVLPPTIPLRKEYDANEEQLHKMGNPEELRNEVFSHLVTFFSRYYEGGDFLSKRRYKADTYAIPVLDVKIEGKRSPLMVAVGQTTASLAKCFNGEIRKITYPVFP